MSTASSRRPPLPPFTEASARQKVRMAENGWNGRDPEIVSLVYTEDGRWRNRAEFPVGREQIVAFLRRKWEKEQDRITACGALQLISTASPSSFGPIQ